MQSACSRGPLIQSLSRRTFFEGAPLKQAGPGGADTDTGPLSNPTTKTKEVSVQEGPSQRQTPEVGVNEQYFKQSAKSNSVSVAINTCILASHVVNCSILGHYNEITCFSSTARIPFLSTTCALIILLLACDCKNGASERDSCRYKLKESATG